MAAAAPFPVNIAGADYATAVLEQDEDLFLCPHAAQNGLEPFAFLGKGPFDLPTVSFTAEVSESVLAGQGLAWHRMDSGADSALVCSTPERAMLELCDGVSDAALVYEADALMQAMTTDRKSVV